MRFRIKNYPTPQAQEADNKQTTNPPERSHEATNRAPGPSNTPRSGQRPPLHQTSPFDPTQNPTQGSHRNVLQGRWVLGHRLGRGAFGVVFHAFDLQTKQCVALKTDGRKIDGHTVLEREYIVYGRIFRDEKPEGFTHPIDFIKSPTVDVMVLPRLGKTIGALYREFEGEFDFMSVVELGIQMLSRLEYIHRKGYVHLDIKPANMMLGEGDNSSTVYLIDFGTARRYLNTEGELIAFGRDFFFIGTTVYASMYIHERLQPSPRDDLESLWYSLVLLHKNQLPWTDTTWKLQLPNESTNDGRGLQSRMATTKRIFRQRLCDDMPESFQECWRIITSMQYGDMPSYPRLRELLERASHEYTLP